MVDSMDKKFSNVPNLRFPEFSDEWIFLKLQNCCRFFSGGTPLSTNKELYKGTIPFIRSGEIHSDKTELFISEQALKCSSAKMVNSGDLLLALYGATSGEIDISKITGAINQAILCIRTNQNNKFIKYQWQKNKNRILETYLQGGQGNLSGQIVSSLSFGFPMLEEQNKIVSLMDKVEERINTQNKIIRELFALKCGLCQMIKEKQKTAPVFLVKDICKIGRGRVISKAEIEKAESHTYPVFSSQTSNNGVMGYIDSYDFDGEYLTWTTDGANAGTVFYHNEKFNCTNVCGTLKIVNESINPYFLYLILENASQKYVSKNLANPKLMNDTMANIKVNIPDLKCQNNFVNVCKTIEKRIKVEEEIFRLLLDKKKFLLSNLFI